MFLRFILEYRGLLRSGVRGSVQCCALCLDLKTFASRTTALQNMVIGYKENCRPHR